MSSLPALVPIDDARAELLSRLPRLCSAESIITKDCVGRVLAEDVIAPIDVPPRPNSSMDGYAIAFDDVSGVDAILRVSQRVPAGHAPAPLEKGSAARIFTGGEIPDGADTIVIQEDVRVLENGAIQINEMPSKGEWVRAAGLDISTGERVIPAGTRLTPAAIGVCASLGITHLSVFKRLKVALLSTGDELVEPGLPLAAGKIYNSNRQLIGTLIEQAGFEWVDMPRVEDSADATITALKQAVANADAIITTGGVSVGEEDHVKSAITSLGTLDLWRIRIRPGKPFAAGEIDGTPIFGLPGNPMSSLVTFALLARPCLMHLQGASYRTPLTLPVRSGITRAALKRDEFMRVMITEGVATAVGSQNSGVLSSALTADGLLHLPAFEAIEKGKTYNFIPFSALIG